MLCCIFLLIIGNSLIDSGNADGTARGLEGIELCQIEAWMITNQDRKYLMLSKLF